MHRGRSVGPLVVAIALLTSAGCSSKDEPASSTTTTATATASTTSPDDADRATGGGGAPVDRSGDTIVADATLRIPGEGGTAAVYEIRNLRLTSPTTQSDCPGGTPISARRLAAELTAYQELAPTDDVNVTPNDVRPPIPDMSMLPEIVLVDVDESSQPDDQWFVAITGQAQVVGSVPNTLLRPAPPAATTSDTCAIVGWSVTGTTDPLLSTELEVTSDAFVPKDFDPADYQVRVGRGADFAYCWPLDELDAGAELGQCR